MSSRIRLEEKFNRLEAKERYHALQKLPMQLLSIDMNEHHSVLASSLINIFPDLKCMSYYEPMWYDAFFKIQNVKVTAIQHLIHKHTKWGVPIA